MSSGRRRHAQGCQPYVSCRGDGSQLTPASERALRGLSDPLAPQQHQIGRFPTPDSQRQGAGHTLAVTLWTRASGREASSSPGHPSDRTTPLGWRDRELARRRSGCCTHSSDLQARPKAGDVERACVAVTSAIRMQRATEDRRQRCVCVSSPSGIARQRGPTKLRRDLTAQESLGEIRSRQYSAVVGRVAKRWMRQVTAEVQEPVPQLGVLRDPQCSLAVDSIFG